jgi:peptidoglycan/LPS O-acetylase OafA/YrhL
LLVTGVAGGGLGVLATMAATLVLAYACWRLIEKPALGFKRHPVYAHMAAEPAGLVA